MASTQKYTKFAVISTNPGTYPAKPNALPLATAKPPLLPTPQIKTPQTKQLVKPQQFIPAEVRAEKLAKGLCYYCDQKYERGHKCKFREPQLFTVEIPGGDVEENWESDGDCTEEVEDCVIKDSDPCISVSALTGSQTFSTMRVRGLVQNKPLHILIDSGSTHNFLDITMASKLKCEVSAITKQEITVADGNSISCQNVVKNFSWRMGGYDFTSEVMLIDLGSCDMVLGVQWLSTLGTVKWNFNKLLMEFQVDKQFIRLKGVAPQKLKVVSAESSKKLFKNAAQLCFIQIQQLNKGEPEESASSLENQNQDLSDHQSELEMLKSQYGDIFMEPKELPPSRGVFDHRIPLMEGSNPINIRPYRYPLKQRDVIEQMIDEMLQKGIIQNSASPFASPVVLVGKKDGSWRLCVDYRELNKKTIKDKFPIPVVDELIDELSGSTVFSKLDLRAGYHQLRMCDKDVFKTAFKTHSGHYEFLVMPFGLTNAPASFQGWMNAIFKPLLRRCVLVFFDDILIYSKTAADHWVHLKQVFELMRANLLFAKESKCSFMMEKVEYLGHFISAKGVETDAKKIKVVANWPVPTNVKELRSFLGLAGYYRKFIKNYAWISRELTDQLRKGAFNWNDNSQSAFDNLKTALVSAPVLALPDFNKLFVV
ncbi:hypothetical protein DCAR_0519686 [Daucus carota subsp. sativus]|uniref:Reverse transcriptase domain-containing protein n=2 Tax=Daucus carota subsp. sativus TaxID=79200 RepID=A0AAF0X4B7_DAUCS|nr:hypothetical protein DCAR_0519686 [Daucus carota subsp. sativus]